jgi:hypothetical protein
MDGAHELAPEIRHEEKIENSAPKKFGSPKTRFPNFFSQDLLMFPVRDVDSNGLAA